MDFTSLVPEQLAWVLIAVSQVVGAILVFVAFTIAGFIAKAIIRRIHHRNAQEQKVLILLGSVVKYGIIIAGMVVALSMLGTNPLALTTGLGAVGVILTVTFQGFLTDMFGGFFIVFSHTFQVGDIITVNGNTGRVETITLRTVTLAAEDKRIIVPNSIIAKEIFSVNLR